MSIKHIGNNGVAKIGALACGGLRDITIQEQAAVADSSELGDAWDTHIPGSKNWNGALTLWWDDTDAAQAACVVGASITFGAYFEGTGSGSHYKTGTATIVSVGEKVSRNATVERTVSVTGNGALSTTVVP
jgi:hypothetical protein